VSSDVVRGDLRSQMVLQNTPIIYTLSVQHKITFAIGGSPYIIQFAGTDIHFLSRLPNALKRVGVSAVGSPLQQIDVGLASAEDYFKQMTPFLA
jgi:hypothetical protein